MWASRKEFGKLEFVSADVEGGKGRTCTHFPHLRDANRETGDTNIEGEGKFVKVYYQDPTNANHELTMDWKEFVDAGRKKEITYSCAMSYDLKN